MKLWLILGAVNGFLSVALGAFAAHGLAGKVGEKELAAFETGARYHMYHALALLAVAWLAQHAFPARFIISASPAAARLCSSRLWAGSPSSQAGRCLPQRQRG